jgi:hypothetical protein
LRALVEMLSNLPELCKIGADGFHPKGKVTLVALWAEATVVGVRSVL